MHAMRQFAIGKSQFCNWYLHRLIHAGFSIAMTFFFLGGGEGIYRTCLLPLNPGFGMVLYGFVTIGTFRHPLECHEVHGDFFEESTSRSG